jgi:hypothetical protein
MSSMSVILTKKLIGWPAVCCLHAISRTELFWLIAIECRRLNCLLWSSAFIGSFSKVISCVKINIMKVGINQNRTFYNLSRTNTSIHRHFRHTKIYRHCAGFIFFKVYKETESRYQRQCVDHCWTSNNLCFN